MYFKKKQTLVVIVYQLIDNDHGLVMDGTVQNKFNRVSNSTEKTVKIICICISPQKSYEFLTECM